MGLLDELLKAQKPKRNLMGTQMVKGPDQPYLRQDYPTVYGALGGLLGTAPDEMAGSVLDPNTAAVRQGAEYGFPVGTALGMLPVLGPGQKVGMTLGRAGEQFAERAVPQVMERGGLLAEMMQGMGRGTVSPLDVYHGTPHTLPPTPRNPLGEFDASKIGTGEGAQSYGLGIYTAENPDVAKSYQFMEQNWFDTSKAKYKGKSINSWYEQAQKDQERAFRTKNNALEKDATARLAYWENIMTHNHPENVLKQFTDPEYGWDEATNYAKSIDLNKFSGVPRSGNLYKADLPDEKIAQMIDYDKPMAEQRNLIEKMRKALVGPDSPLSRVKQFEINETLNDSVRMRNLYPQSIINLNEPQIVERLRQVGIPGIKYFDEGSRGAETSKQTRNFVSFPGEEKNLRILERNSEKAPDLLASPIDEEELRRLQSGLLYAP
jgi:hypothetical protein